MDKAIIILEDQIVSISPKILWIVFVLVFIFALIFTLMLNHHWHLYESTNPKMHRGRILYFLVLIILLISALISLIIFQTLT